MDMQNVSNLQIPEGAVRTIHDKDSRLIWGRVAYNTKYAGDTFQQTYSGKNLFNYQGVVNLAIATLISARPNYRGYYIQANAGDTFTLSRATTTGNNRFRVCFTMVKPAPGVDIYNENGVVERYISADGATEVSFTVPQDMHYVFIYLSSSDQDITESLKIQLETGSTATAYEPYVGGIPSPNPDYPQDVNVVTGAQTVTISDGTLSEDFTVNLGNIELCKIGTYQDYIYKSGDDWYVHKAINKVILDGSEVWSMYSGRNGTFYMTKSDIMPAPSISATPDVISDYYEPKPFASLYNMIVDYGVANHNAQHWIAIRNKDYSDVSSFKTWLASNNTTVYYVLATPTDTQITDATLVGQLNAVHEWLTRYGYESTVFGDLPIVLQRDSLQ